MIEKLKAKFTQIIPETIEAKIDKKDEIGIVVAREIRDGRDWLTVRYESGDVSGFKDEVFKIIKD